MARPQPEFGVSFLCGTHNRFVKTGPRDGILIHTSGNQEAVCSGERYTIIVKREGTRAEVLAELAALAGRMGNHDR